MEWIYMKLEETIQKWCEAHPEIASYFKQLNDNGVRWAIFAGTSVSLLTGNRTPTDVDIIVHDDDFETTMNLTLNAERKLPLECDLPTGDGKTLHYRGNELAFKLDGTELEVMANARKTVAGHIYDISFTDLAVKNRITITLPQVTIYTANPFDTIAIKAIMQRGVEQNKFDFEDTKALIAVCDISASYIKERTKQIDLDERALNFMRKAGMEV
jgi:hypothetical protein